MSFTLIEKYINCDDLNNFEKTCLKSKTACVPQLVDISIVRQNTKEIYWIGPIKIYLYYDLVSQGVINI